MKSLETIKILLLFCLVLIIGYIAQTYHVDRYQAVNVGDRLYLVDKRTGATFYPAGTAGAVKWQRWVPPLDGREGR
ncbi:MAG TPA: hypothetical protein VGE15_07675 [Sphingobacteriaceae bacterium]